MTKDGTCENMVLVFCYGLFNSSGCDMKAIRILRQRAFGIDKIAAPLGIGI